MFYMCIQPCFRVNDSQLICKIPVLKLPEEFRNLSDSGFFSVYKSDHNSTLAFTESVLLDNEEYGWWNNSFDFLFTTQLPTIHDYPLHNYDGDPLKIQVCQVLRIKGKKRYCVLCRITTRPELK